MKIRSLKTHPVIAPLAMPVTTASGAVSEAPLLLIDLVTDQGITGRAYLLAYQRAMLKPLDVLVQSLAEMIAGDALVPVEIEKKLRARFTLLGGTRGLAGIAISGIDMAAWDALAQSKAAPLAVLLGGTCKPIRAYNSLGMIAAGKVPAQAETALAGGFTALKFKIGWPTLEEDLATVRAFKKAVPAGTSLMVHFNQSLTVP